VKTATKSLLASLLATAISAPVIAPAAASELVYYPVNPSFGGNPNNSGHLIGLAGSQNRHRPVNEQDSPLQEFNDRLQRSLLGRITSAVTRDIVDNDGNITPGTFETLDYAINIVDDGGGLMTIETIDKVTGETTTIQVRNDVDL